MNDEDTSAAFAALGHPTRFRIMQLLAHAAPEGQRAGEIAEALATKPNTLTEHLNILRRAGLVSARRSGRSIFYRTESDRLDVLVETIKQISGPAFCRAA